jgi:hypothetical protein
MFKYSTEFKVGLFTLICIAVLIITAFILGGNPFTGRSQDFYTVLDNAGGVAQRTQIRVSGVKVGTVSQVDILPKGARVELKIDGSVKVPTGSHIEIVSRGVLGDVYMEIVRNESGVGYLKSGDYLPFNTDGNNVQSLVKSLNSITRDIKQVSNTLANVLGTKEGETSLKNIVANIEGMTKDPQHKKEMSKKLFKPFGIVLCALLVCLKKMIQKSIKLSETCINLQVSSGNCRLLKIGKKWRQLLPMWISPLHLLKRCFQKLKKGKELLASLLQRMKQQKKSKPHFVTFKKSYVLWQVLKL